MSGIGDFQGLCAEYEQEIEERNKEINQLRREKKWLVNNYVKTLRAQPGEYTAPEYEIIIIDAMQQALKEEK